MDECAEGDCSNYTAMLTPRNYSNINSTYNLFNLPPTATQAQKPNTLKEFSGGLMQPLNLQDS